MTMPVFKQIEKGTLLGIFLLFVTFALTLSQSESTSGIYFSGAAFTLVIIGTLGATCFSFSFTSIKTAFLQSKQVLRRNEFNIADTIELCVHLANVYRKKGILSLEEQQIDDEFVKHGVDLILDGYDAENIEHMLNKEIFYTRERNEKAIEVFDALTEYAPAMGMIGTLIGLVAMLSGLSTPDTIGKGMSVALLTTLYGAIVANCITSPIAKKLKERSNETLVHQSLVKDAVIKLLNKEPPRMIFDFLQTYVETYRRKSLKELKIT